MGKRCIEIPEAKTDLLRTREKTAPTIEQIIEMIPGIEQLSVACGDDQGAAE
jgi:hypothetical protein